VAFHNTISVSHYCKRVATVCTCCHILYKVVFYISNDILQPLKKFQIESDIAKFDFLIAAVMKI